MFILLTGSYQALILLLASRWDDIDDDAVMMMMIHIQRKCLLFPPNVLVFIWNVCRWSCQIGICAPRSTWFSHRTNCSRMDSLAEVKIIIKIIIIIIIIVIIFTSYKLLADGQSCRGEILWRMPSSVNWSLIYFHQCIIVNCHQISKDASLSIKKHGHHHHEGKHQHHYNRNWHHLHQDHNFIIIMVNIWTNMMISIIILINIFRVGWVWVPDEYINHISIIILIIIILEGAEYECPMTDHFKETNGRLCMSIR